jgi:tetratricopeptide (TPR) repeat protein
MPRRPSTHVDSPAAVGERLRAARLAAGLSQRDLSFDGCTAAYVSRIEAGARTPSYQILREFAQRLGVTADFLATGDQGTLEPDPLVEAEIALRLGTLDRAEEIYERARGKNGDAASAARADAGLGAVALARGDARRAIDLLTQALDASALPREEEESAAEALGRAYAEHGQFDEALGLLERFLEAARGRRDRFAVARFGVLLAYAYVESGNLGLAEDALAEALADASAILDPMHRADLYWSQSRLYLAEGKPDLAAEYASLASATLRSTDHQLAAARGLALLARIENDRGHGAAALARLDEAMPELACAGDEAEQAMASIERARALALLGEQEEAVSLMLDVISRPDDARPAAAALAYASAAAFFRAHGDGDRALELYERAMERAPAAGRHTAEALTAMAEIHEERGDAEEALKLLKAALTARGGLAAA